jgi:hypothetical protein
MHIKPNLCFKHPNITLSAFIDRSILRGRLIDIYHNPIITKNFWQNLILSLTKTPDSLKKPNKHHPLCYTLLNTSMVYEHH